MPDARPHDFHRPTPSEVWWVAVEGAPDPSGGWIVLADEGEAGAREIQETFSKGRIPILAAVDAASLAIALERPEKDQGKEHAVVWMNHALGYGGRSIPGSSAQALVTARLGDTSAHIVLSQSQEAVEELSRRLSAVPSSRLLEGVRMDLRSAPRGQGSWGLTVFRTVQADRDRQI